MAVERIDVERAECFADIVDGHRGFPSTTRKPDSFLVFVIATMIPSVFGVAAAPTSMLGVSCTGCRLQEQKSWHPANP